MRQTPRELSQNKTKSPFTIACHLHQMGNVHIYGVWLPLVLTKRNKLLQIYIAASILARLQASRGYKHEIGWDVLPHTSYSSDLAISDYHPLSVAF